MHLSARIAQPEEKPLLYSLYEEAMKAHIEKIWGWDASWQENDFAKAFGASKTYVIEYNSKFAGYFQIETSCQPIYLRMLILHPDMKSIGVGARVLNEILGACQDSGRNLALRVFKINTEAKRFYEREGWHVATEEEAFYVMAHSSCPVAPGPNKSFQQTSSQIRCLIAAEFGLQGRPREVNKTSPSGSS